MRVGMLEVKVEVREGGVDEVDGREIDLGGGEEEVGVS